MCVNWVYEWRDGAACVKVLENDLLFKSLLIIRSIDYETVLIQTDSPDNIVAELLKYMYHASFIFQVLP